MDIGQTGSAVENYLTYLTRRQAVIASNIANADTPGYHTQDIPQPSSFSDILQSQSNPPVEIATGHTQNDGNNVDLDREARILSENSLHFNIGSQLIKSQFKMLRLAVQDGKQ